MRIAICHPVYWPEVRRGAERYARELADALAARGHAPFILTTARARPSVTVEEGIAVHRLWRPPLDARLYRRAFEPFLHTIPQTTRALARLNPDVALALQPATAVAAARWDPARSVFAYMGLPHRAGLANRRARLATMERACAQSAAVVALSEAARAGFERWLGVDARVIHPPVDTAAFAPGPPRTEHPTVVFAADPAEPRKGFAALAEAWPRVRRSFPAARLLVNRSHVPLPDGAQYVDLDERAALARVYASAWASVLPSIGEAFGLVLAEALACGTPAVGSRRDGIPEVLGSEPERVGALVGPDDDLAHALAHAFALARDPATATACRAQAERFTAERCAAAHEALYTELSC